MTNGAYGKYGSVGGGEMIKPSGPCIKFGEVIISLPNGIGGQNNKALVKSGLGRRFFMVFVHTRLYG